MYLFKLTKILVKRQEEHKKNTRLLYIYLSKKEVKKLR